MTLSHSDVYSARGSSLLTLNLGIRYWRVVGFQVLPSSPPKRTSGIHGIGGWVGPRGELDVLEETKIPAPAGYQTLIP